MSARLGGIITAWRSRFAAALALVALACVAASHGAESNALVKVRFGGDQAQTRIVIELAQPVQAQLTADGADDQHAVLTFAKLTVGDDLDGQGKGLVKAWALERAGAKTRLSLDLTRKARVKRRFLLPPSQDLNVYRYVIDIEADGPDAAQTADKPSLIKTALTSVGLSGSSSRSPKPIVIKKVIVIDAGHGGHDPGALGGKAREKDVTLAAAKALKDRLEDTGRFKVVLTRDSDVYVPLENRVQIARAANADLFISLHADAGQDPKVRGATVYTLSDHGVDRAAHSVFGGGSFIDVHLPGRDQSVKQILLDLTQRTTRNRSGAFAETLLDHIGQQTMLLRRSHRDAGYLVLLAPDVPAVLLEMGFITNAEDEAKLTDPDGRAQLMDAVGDSIESYFSPGVTVAER